MSPTDKRCEECSLLKRLAVGVGLIWCFYTLFAHFGWLLPGPQSSPQLIMEFLHYNHGPTAVVTFWGVVTTLLFLIFGNTLISIASPQNCYPVLQRVAQGGLLSYVVLTLASQSVMLSITYFFPATYSQVLTVTGYQMAWAIDPSMVIFLTWATFIGTLSWLTLKTRILPHWLSWSGLIMAALLFFSTSFILIGVLSLMIPVMEALVPLWFAIVVIHLMREPKLPTPLPETDLEPTVGDPQT